MTEEVAAEMDVSRNVEPPPETFGGGGQNAGMLDPPTSPFLEFPLHVMITARIVQKLSPSEVADLLAAAADMFRAAEKIAALEKAALDRVAAP